MKPKALLNFLALTSAILISTGTAPAQPSFGVPGGSAPMIDPMTGLPIAPPVEPWMDPNWHDPEKTLGEVSYDNLPVAEVARDLEKQFTNAFDILLPHNWEGGSGSEGRDWLATPVHLRLKNVTASEIFNAMNLLFENNRTPLRWVLKQNGNRELALLRVLEQPILQNEPGSPQRPWRKVFFVGDLIGDEKAGGMNMGQIIETVHEVYAMSYGRPIGGVQYHKEAQLLIVTATADQMNLIEQTLTALKEKVELDRRRAAQSPGAPIEGKASPAVSNAKGPK